MYTFGLDSPKTHEYLHRTVALIERLEVPATHEWIMEAPAASSEIARLETTVRGGPVNLEGTLRSAAMAALESAAHVRFSIQSDHYTLTTMRGMMRTILMGAGRLGYVALPEKAQVRETNAATLVGQEARSFKRALEDVNAITTLPGLRWKPDEVREFDRQISEVKAGRLPGDGTIITEAADLMGAWAAAADSRVDPSAVRDHLTWVWNTASGSAHGFDWQGRASGDFVTDIGLVVSAFHRSFDAIQRIWQ